MKTLLLKIFGVLSAVCYASVFLSAKWVQLTQTDIEFDELPDELDGLRILHISDLHGNNSKTMSLDIWKTVKKQKFDMAVITGDMVVRELNEIDPHLEHINRLCDRVPVYYVNGNHEISFQKQMIEKLSQVGVKGLDDECDILEINGVKLPIIGFKSYYMLKKYGFNGLDELFKENPGFKLVLSHEPQPFDRFAGYSNFLMLCGHTHGGQLRLPFLPTLFAPGQGLMPKYGDGVYKKNGAALYISRGIGTTIFPIRFFNRPEIAVITLKRG